MRTSHHRPRSLRGAWLALTGLACVFLVEMLDNSILTMALPTIGRELDASAVTLQWITAAYAVVFGGSMLVLSAWADRVGRRRVMLLGLALLAVSSLATVFVTTAPALIAVRALMGIAAAMTTPGSLALAFRLFDDDATRVRATTVISTAGLVGLAIGPTVGGIVLAFAPWQSLLLVNVPIAAVAFVAISRGIPADRAEDLHREPIDVVGAGLGTMAIVGALAAPTLLLGSGTAGWLPWTCAGGAMIAAIVFVVWERRSAHPLIDLRVIGSSMVASGLAFKAAASLAVAGSGYLITLQLQYDWGWSPAQAALAMLPQVIVLIVGGVLIAPLMRWIGLERAAWAGAIAVAFGLALYALLGRTGYPWIAVALMLIAAGMRVVGVVAGTNVLRGLPPNRTTIGAALVDTAGELATAVGIAISGTVLAAIFSGSLSGGIWSSDDTVAFRDALLVAGVILTLVAATLVVWGILRARGAGLSSGTSSPSAHGRRR